MTFIISIKKVTSSKSPPITIEVNATRLGNLRMKIALTTSNFNENASEF